MQQDIVQRAQVLESENERLRKDNTVKEAKLKFIEGIEGIEGIEDFLKNANSRGSDDPADREISRANTASRLVPSAMQSNVVPNDGNLNRTSGFLQERKQLLSNVASSPSNHQSNLVNPGTNADVGASSPNRTQGGSSVSMHVTYSNPKNSATYSPNALRGSVKRKASQMRRSPSSRGKTSSRQTSKSRDIFSIPH